MASKDRKKAIKSVFKGGSIVFIGIIASKFLGLAYRVLVGRYLGPSEYGVISVMMAVFSVSTTLMYVGIPNGVQRYLSYYLERDDREGARGALRTGIQILTLTSIIGAIGLYFLAPWLANTLFNEPRAIWPIRMVAVILPLRAYTILFTRVTNAFEQMQYQVYTGRIYLNVSKIIVAGLLVYLGQGYLGAAFGYAFAFGSAVIVALYFAYKVFPDGLSPTKKARYNYSEMFHHSWPLMAAGVFGIITGHIDTFMIQSFRGSSEVGMYQAAYPFASLLTVGTSIFSGIFLSNASKLVSKGKEGELVSTYRTLVKWISIVTVPVFLILFAFPRTALTVFGSQYYGVANVLRILLVGFLLSTLIGPVSNIYQAVGRTKLNFVASVIVASFNAVINFILIPMDTWYGGVTGAAIASTTAFILVFIFHFATIKHILGAQPFRGKLLKVWFSGLVSIASVYILSNTLFEITPKWFFPINLAIFSLIYGILLLVLRTIEEDDMVVMRAIKDKTGIETELLEKIIKKFS